MWTLLRFLVALCLAYWTRGLLQPRSGRPSPGRHVLMPNIVSAVIIFAVLSLVRYWASAANYSQHVPYTLILVLLAQSVWLVCDLLRASDSRSLRRPD